MELIPKVLRVHSQLMAEKAQGEGNASVRM